jgi:hypothetical protein
VPNVATGFSPSFYRAAFWIFPLRRQRVQTRMRLTAEPTLTRTLWRFGIQRRLDTLWAWLIRFPNTGALPHTSHIFAMKLLLK